MAKLEKVLNAFVCCIEHRCEDCYIGGPGFGIECRKKLKRDALNLLREREWRKFEFREPDEEEKAAHPEWCYVMENTPDDDEEILVSNGRYVWKDEFCNNGDECYLDSGHEMEGCWWMPMPEPPKEEEDA